MQALPAAPESAAPPQMSYVAAKVAKDKAVTNALLQSAGLSVPRELCINGRDYDRAMVGAFLTEQKMAGQMGWRVRLDGFADGPEASAFCERVRSAGTTCSTVP